eukprot:TRINITY_DN18746_c0_g1_i1.p1 TRINITY_DN18746_c0_g1~~TRINITY_DN18746_c0_g1_i1.p1  ORF type:complete len:217 (+),score=34.50 TRINITY_DN18746_c0_g1_i1:156-806(+)
MLSVGGNGVHELEDAELSLNTNVRKSGSASWSTGTTSRNFHIDDPEPPPFLHATGRTAFRAGGDFSSQVDTLESKDGRIIMKYLQEQFQRQEAMIQKLLKQSSQVLEVPAPQVSLLSFVASQPFEGFEDKIPVQESSISSIGTQSDADEADRETDNQVRRSTTRVEDEALKGWFKRVENLEGAVSGCTKRVDAFLRSLQAGSAPGAPSQFSAAAGG